MDQQLGSSKEFHQPVMLAEVLTFLRVKPGGVYVDCTVGGGGHSREILRLSQPDGFLLGLDRDPYALQWASRYLSVYQNRFKLVRENFVHLPQVLGDLGIDAVDGLVYDLGVSSAQLDNPQRGFSYMDEGPLDMRMDPEDSVTARDLVNNLPEEELAAIIKKYGEERWADRIAAFIVQERSHRAVESTTHLVQIIKRAIPAGARRQGPHPAKRTFQALRIAVNQELQILPAALKEAIRFLKPEGRICVITFHSLEDRIVKQVFLEMAGKCTCPPDFPVCICGCKPQIRVVTPRPVVPSRDEMVNNPRSRSARLRVAEKVLKTGKGE